MIDIPVFHGNVHTEITDFSVLLHTLEVVLMSLKRIIPHVSMAVRFHGDSVV